MEGKAIVATYKHNTCNASSSELYHPTHATYGGAQHAFENAARPIDRAASRGRRTHQCKFGGKGSSLE